MSSRRNRGGIFINYRREDTAAQASALFSFISDHFGADRVFMDVDSIASGASFVTAIQQAVSQCDVLLALIGRNWLAIADRSGKRVIEDPDDFVRAEIETALRREIPVIPVLVDGATLPRTEDLPPSLRSLTTRQAVELSQAHFRDDATRLISDINHWLGDEPGQPAEAEEMPSQPPDEESVRLSDAQQAALAEAQRAVERNPNDPDAYSRLASLMQAAGHTEEALDLARHAVDLNPDDAELYSSVAGLLQAGGRTDEALDLARHAVELDPANPELGRQLAALLQETGRTDEASAALQRAVLPSSYLAGGIDTDRVDPTCDIPLSRDHLNESVWVSMLATVIVDKATPMPLSVGLFGEWGAGKSYFMGMLRSEVDRLAHSGREPYLQHVVQIGFNAWHYADTNLWASLGDEIFRQLAGPEKADASRKRLKEELARGSAEQQALKAREAQAQAETVRLKGALQEAKNNRKERAGDLLKAVSESRELQQELDKVWQRLGISDTAQQAQTLADQVRGTAEEASAVRTLLGRQRTWVLAAACLIALLAVVAAALVPASWGKWLAGGGATFIALALGTAVTWLGRVTEGFSQLQKIATDLSTRAEASAEQRASEKVSGAVEELRRAEACEAMVQAQLDEMSAHVQQLARDLAVLMPDERLYAFLAERADGGQYAGQLGLISTIRKDFERLVELLKDWHAHPPEKSMPCPIDRIVLYIDDLDRCSPQQVVDVLQAVHLLLALDLFVVVVGVDPRWLRRSLQHQYSGMLEAKAPPESSDQGLWNITPDDYLEKIFNIPFVLAGIPAGSLGPLLRGLAAASGDSGQSGEGQLTSEAQRSSAQPGAGPDSGVSTVRPGDSMTAEPRSELAASQAGNAGDLARPLTEPELTLLSGLGCFIATPREAKRMFNLYRMLRSTRDLSDASTFLGDDRSPGDYQAVALLLGMMTADARVLRDVLDAEPQAEHKVAGGLNHRPDKDDWHKFIAGFTPEHSGEEWTNQIIGQIPAQDVPAWQQFAKRAAETSNLIALPDLTAFKRWAPRIQRFSFVLSPLNVADGGPRATGPDESS
jgi:tetratricopeptide (TPR) repeat protein